MLTVVHDRDVFRDGYTSRQSEIDALEATIADKDAALADKDAIIAQLQAQLSLLLSYTHPSMTEYNH